MRQRETEDEAKQFDHARAASALPNYSNDMLSRSRPISEYFNRISLYIFFVFLFLLSSHLSPGSLLILFDPGAVYRAHARP